MTVEDLYFKRKRRERGELPDNLTYDVLPGTFRQQMVYVMNDAFGDGADYHRHPEVRAAYKLVVEVLCRELGRPGLTGVRYGERAYYAELTDFILNEQETEYVLSAIEMILRVAPYCAEKYRHYADRSDASEAAAKAVEEANARFKEHGLGFQFESVEIVRVDSQFLHQEAVRPALRLLADPMFQGAEEEFLKAFEHHRNSEEKDALAWSLKAFESTLKIICAKRQWAVRDNAQAKELISVAFDNGLIDPMWQSEFASLRSVLESGVPTARNKKGGHGQGGTLIEVPGHLAAFVLHQTAATIVFLIEAHQELP